jgi:hypothetical protein
MQFRSHKAQAPDTVPHQSRRRGPRTAVHGLGGGGQRAAVTVSHPARLWRGGDFNLNVLLGLQQALPNGAIELLRGGRFNSLR